LYTEQVKTRNQKYFTRFIEPIRQKLPKSGFRSEILKEKAAVGALPIVRIVLDSGSSNDCFAVYGLVADIYIPNPDRFKNFISVPREDGYQAIHSTLFGPEGRMVEIRICTREMLTDKPRSKER